MKRHLASVEAGDGAAVELSEDVVDVGRGEVDQRRVGVQRFIRRERAALEHGFIGERHVAAARLRQRSRIGRHIRRGLLRHRLVDLLAGAGDRVRGADVRGGRHHRDVGCERDQEAGGSGASRGRADEDDDRRARGDQTRDDGARRFEQAARSFERNDQRGGAVRIRGVDGVEDEFGADGMDDVVDRRHVDERRRHARRTDGG